MQNTELYTLRFDGRDIHFEGCEDNDLIKALQNWDGTGILPPVGKDSYEQQYIAGHEETLLCRIYRKVGGTGGLVAVYDATGLLLVAQADSNLILVEGAGHFARMSTYIRYGADIFEHDDADDD